MTYKAIKQTVRKYYKYGTTPNATVVGTPTITNGVVSGFSTSNYVDLPDKFNPNSSPWEIVLKFYITDFTNASYLIGDNYSNSDKKMIIRAMSSGFQADFNTGVAEYFLTLNISKTLDINTWYYIKIKFTGTEYSISVSTHEDFTDATTSQSASSTAINSSSSSHFHIGARLGSSSNLYTYGSIDLTKSYIKIDGKDWWHGTKATEATSTDYDFYKDVDVYSVPKIDDKYYGVNL